MNAASLMMRSSVLSNAAGLMKRSSRLLTAAYSMKLSLVHFTRQVGRCGAPQSVSVGTALEGGHTSEPLGTAGGLAHPMPGAAGSGAAILMEYFPPGPLMHSSTSKSTMGLFMPLRPTGLSMHIPSKHVQCQSIMQTRGVQQPLSINHAYMRRIRARCHSIMQTPEPERQHLHILE